MLYSLQRWWVRYGRQVLLASLVLGICLGIRQTKGAVLYELFALISKPFHLANKQPDWERDADRLQLETSLLELDQQNRRLRQLIGEKDLTSKQRIIARIIARSADNWWQEVTISRGSSSGIVEGSAVLASGGLVGRVSKVTPNTSQVLLLSDTKTRIGVKVVSSRDQGLIRGIADNRVKVRFFKKDPIVKPGDVIVTSSNSTQFPAGLPIGTVQSYEPKSQPLPEAVIQLNAQISQLEWVSVIPLNAPGQPLIPFGETGAPIADPKPKPASPAAEPPAAEIPSPVVPPIKTGAQ
jgi:rod shape-determining protein MreC